MSGIGIWAVKRRATRVRANLLRAGGIGAVAIGVVGAGMMLATSTANADPAPPPRFVEGNVTTCEEAGLTGEILFEGQGGDASGEAGSGTVSGDGTTLDVTINAGFTATGIAVKGAQNTNVYDGPFVGPVTIEGMVSPDNPGGAPEISHWLVCGFETPPTPSPSETPSPSPSETPSPSPSETPSPSPSETPSPSPSETPSPSPSETPSPSPSETPSPSPSETPSPSPSVSPPATPSVTPGAPTSPPPVPELPLTGHRTNLLLGGAAILLTSGMLLIAAARRLHRSET